MESSRLLGLVLALGIVAGAAGAFVMTRAGTSAQGAQAAVEAPPAVEAQHTDVALEPVATAAPTPPVTQPPVERRPAVTTPSPRQASSRAAVTARPPMASDSARAETPAWQVAPAPVVPAPDPPTGLEPDVIAAVEEPKFEDLVLPAESVLGVQLESTLSSDTAQVEDQVNARVTRDVRVGDRVVIPAGSRATGLVTLVERGGRLKDRARLGVRFTSVTLANGTRVPIVTEAISREGDSPRNESAAKIGGGAIGGAIIGGILGGAKGAAIGGSIGAGAGSAAVYAGGRNAATLTAGTPITVRLESPATITVER